MYEYVVDLSKVMTKTTEELGGFDRFMFLQGVPVREEIVRCRDCKRFGLDNSDHDYRSGWWCHRWNTDMVKPDGFCAWGERKDA